MRVVGIDPGMSNCGLALLEDGKLVRSEQVKTDPDDSRGRRLQQIFEAISKYLWAYAPDAVALEGYAMGARFGREQMGEVGGIVKLVCHISEIEPVIWQPTSWMKLTLGSGKIAKDLIRLEVYKRYGVDLKTTHEVDAFGVAMAEHMGLTGAPRPRPKKRKETQA